MKYTEYENVDDFLAITRTDLESREAVNGLILGLTLRLRENKLFYGTQPLLATVGQGNTPDLIALMTPPYKLQILSPRGADAAAFEILARELHERKWPVPGLLAEETTALSFAENWTRVTGTRFQTGMKQRIYELREVSHPVYPRGEFKQAGLEDLELAREWSRSFDVEINAAVSNDEDGQIMRDRIEAGAFWFWNDSQPVSMAANGRPTANGEAINLVFTPPERRRKGYATAVVARLSQRILDQGKRFCTLYTDLSNPVSNSIYMKIGYVPQADVLDIHFFD
jgi:predicted GNAT family acetyltransferase